MTDITNTLAERGERYGPFINHATIAQGLQQVLFDAPNWSKLDADMRQALCVICDKMARILNGDASYADNWHDIQGYAKLVERRLINEEEEKIIAKAAADIAESRRVEKEYQDAQDTHAFPVVTKTVKASGILMSGRPDLTGAAQTTGVTKSGKVESSCAGRSFGEKYTG